MELLITKATDCGWIVEQRPEDVCLKSVTLSAHSSKAELIEWLDAYLGKDEPKSPKEMMKEHMQGECL